MVVENAKVALSAIDDHDYSFFDILKGLERFQQVFGEFRQLICSRFADMGLIDHDDDFDLGIDIQ